MYLKTVRCKRVVNVRRCDVQFDSTCCILMYTCLDHFNHFDYCSVRMFSTGIVLFSPLIWISFCFDCFVYCSVRSSVLVSLRSFKDFDQSITLFASIDCSMTSFPLTDPTVSTSVTAAVLFSVSTFRYCISLTVK
jgi:hypothetical protein